MNDSRPDKIRAQIKAASEMQTGDGDSATLQQSPKGSQPRRWPMWTALVIVAIIFGNWLMPRLSVAFDWIATFQLQLVLIALAMTGILFWKKQRLSAAIVLLLIAWPLASLLVLYVPAAQPEPVTRAIRLMTFNVLDSNERYQATLDLIEKENPDIVGLVEFNEQWHQAFQGKLQQYPHRVGPFQGNIIYSKLPLDYWIARKDISTPRSVPGMFATFIVDGQHIYLILVHSTSPKSAVAMAERDAQINGIQTRTRYASAFRHVIVAGDFNATTASHSLQRFVEVARLRDSRRGFGLQHSWPTWCWPISVCIDHCFVSKDVHIENRRVGPDVGSDHLPVIVDFSLGQHPKTR